MLSRSTFALTMLLSSLRGSTGFALHLRRLPVLSASTRRLSVDPSAAAETSSATTKASDSKALGRVTKIKADGSAILEALDSAQMTASAGQLINLQGGKHKAFITWARPPIYFCQLLADSTTGTFPTVEGECDAELPLDDATDCLTITVGQPKLGRMFDYMDQPLDGLGPFTKEEGNDKEVLVRKLPVFNAEPTKGSTTSLHRSLLTGITAVDALTPLGRGQTMLVVGGAGVGRTELCLDAVLAQAKQGVPCVWACLHGQGSAIRAALEERNCLSNTAIVDAPVGSTAAAQFATAAAALSVAEGFRNQGGDALVVIDDLSPLAEFWDGTTLELLDQYGKDRADMGGDSEMRGFYSSLLQRNAQLGQLWGGGSTTSLITMDQDALQARATRVGDEAQAKARALAQSTEDGGGGGDNAAAAPAAAAVSDSGSASGERSYVAADFEGPFYANKTRARVALLLEKGLSITDSVLDKLGIPRPSSDAAAAMVATMHIDSLISLADGHITLSPKLQAAGLYPPLDPSHSLTRIGVGTNNGRTVETSVHCAAIKAIVPKLRLDMASSADLQFSSDSQVAANKAAHNVFAWQAACSQAEATPLRLSEQTSRLFAAKLGLVDATAGAALEGFDLTTQMPEARSAAVAAASECLEAASKHVLTTNAALAEAIDTSTNIDKAQLSELEKTLRSYFSAAQK